MAYD